MKAGAPSDHPFYMITYGRTTPSINEVSEVKMTVAGYVVVRRPEFNYLVHGPDVIPPIGEVRYSGAGRQRWADLFDEDFYAKRAPEDVQTFAIKLKNNSRDLTGIDLCKDGESALKFLKYSNRKGNLNELIVLRSPGLEEVKGTIEVNSAVDWIGYDVVAFGEWSLIAEGVFRSPEYFPAWLPKINRFGLLSDPSLLRQYASAYAKAAAEGRSEPIASEEAGLGTLFIEVGLVRCV